MNRPINRVRQQGVALIIVMLVLSMMIVISAVMSERLFTQFRRATYQMDYQQAYWYGLSVESLAKAIIEKTADEEDEDKDDTTTNTSQPWASGIKNYKMDYGTVSGKLVDKQACLNVNALQKQTDSGGVSVSDVLQHLFESLGVQNYQAEVAADSIREFIDTNGSVDTSFGAEDNYYEGLSPPYIVPNGLIADATELRAVQQISAPLMQKLKPLVCVLPTTEWRLNVNTLTVEQAPLLQALFYPYLSKKAAEDVIRTRPISGWDSLDTMLADSAFQQVDSTVLSKVKGYLGVMSNYFELDAEIAVDDTKLRVRSLMDCTDRENVVVVRRRFGGVDERISDHSTQ